MKDSKEIFSKLKFGDFIIVGVILTVSALLFLGSFFPDKGLRAEICLDGESFAVYELSELTEGLTVNVGSCEILVENDGVTFLSSDCSDKLCINRGKLKKSGDTMACVPERVSVVLKKAKGNDVDAVVF